MELSSENVHRIFEACLFVEGENTANYLLAEGISCRVGFNPDKVNVCRQEIEGLINELPDTFKKNVGGGMSFLNMCEDRNGNLWTGMHPTVDKLVCLGLAIGKLEYLMPRQNWNLFPGGMPYLVIKDQ